jgi:hypothetical protein
MKTLLCWLTVFALALASAAQPVSINFNLVQVNHYHGQDSVLAGVSTPGQRVVVDVGNHIAAASFKSEVPRSANTPSVSVQFSSARIQANGQAIPWEMSRIMFSASGSDSFLVTSSRTGCPGTEIGPSVSVAFPTGRGWSDPPIRFGPLAAMTVCPLGRGYQLEVSAIGKDPPKVTLQSEESLLGKR